VVETTPGEEVSQSVSPWRETGQVRRGSIPWVSDAFRTAETILAQFAMAGRYGTASSICAASGGQHHATYTSDFSGSGMASHQRLTGKQLQATLRTTQVVASKFSVRAVIQKPAKNKKRKDEEPSQDLVGLLEVGGRHRFHPDRPRLLIRGTERRSPRWEHSLERGRTQSARE